MWKLFHTRDTKNNTKVKLPPQSMQIERVEVHTVDENGKGHMLSLPYNYPITCFVGDSVDLKITVRFDKDLTNRNRSVE